MAAFDLVLTTRGSLHPCGEPTEFVSDYGGVIICTDDQTGEETDVGRAHAWRLHAGRAADARESLFDVCDAHSHELHVLHALLYEQGGHLFRDGIIRRFDAMDSDLLVLDYLVLDPNWRGLKLGLLAVRRLVDLVGG